MKIVPFTKKFIEATRKAADEYIGADYFSSEELQNIVERSQKDGLNSSFLLLDDEENVKGFRLSYAPGQWEDLKKDRPMNREKWKVAPKDMAYFQSIFLASDIRGGGWGQKLSEESLKVLKKMGAKAVVCHSWKESPRNSSMRYLEKLGFKPTGEFPEYWIEVDYDCVRCGKPCLCTATEMVLYL